MILNKRISKPPKPFLAPLPFHKKSRKRKVQKSPQPKIDLPRCQFQLIPAPTKYACASPVYHLYGDIALTDYNGDLVSEISLLNNFKTFRSAVIQKIGQESVVTILPEVKDNSSVTKWKQTVQTLHMSSSQHYRDWATIIEEYSKNFEMIRGIQSKRRKCRTQKDRENDLEVTKASEKTREDLFSSYPCMSVKRRFRGLDFQISELTFSKKYLSLIGYPLEGFLGSVLKEGLPQLESFSALTEITSVAHFMQNFADICLQAYKTCEFEANLLLKHNYSRKISYKVFHLPIYEDGIFCLETIMTVTSKCIPQPYYGMDIHTELTKPFLSNAVQEDEHIGMFSQAYYDGFKTQRYKCMDKVCKIKEISSSKESLCDDEPETVSTGRMELLSEKDSRFCKEEEGSVKMEEYVF